MTSWKGLTPDYTFVGIKNFLALATDRRFSIAIKNTVVFTLIFMAGCLLLGFLLAIILDQGLPGEGIFRSIYLFPMSISFIVTGVVWRWLMNPALGDRISGINLIFHNLHLDFLINSWHTTPRVWNRGHCTAGSLADVRLYHGALSGRVCVLFRKS